MEQTYLIDEEFRLTSDALAELAERFCGVFRDVWGRLQAAVQMRLRKHWRGARIIPLFTDRVRQGRACRVTFQVNCPMMELLGG